MNAIRPWGRRLRFWLVIAVATVLIGTMTGASVASPRQPKGFDLDHGNALSEVIYVPFFKAERALMPEGADATLVADHVLTVEMTFFDAIAPYHRTAVGIFSDLGRRPATEHTTRNQNIAVIYAAYTALDATFPQFNAEWRAMVESAGLDPDDRDENTTTPSGIGNLAARKVLDARAHDGSNRYGDEGGRTYNRQPYADYTGYQPVNTAYRLRNPSRWQPNILHTNGIFEIQQFVTPQYGLVEPISYDSPRQFDLAPPTNSDHHNEAAYKRQADEVLHASAHMTDRQKMVAELFNDKLLSLGQVTGNAAFRKGRFDTEEAVHYITTVEMALFDAAIATWHFKRKYDAVRPFSAIRYLYGNKKVTAWGGPGKGTVDDITGKEWRSYVNTADHPEYPSTSTAFCLAYAQAARRFFGDDRIEIDLPRPKGSSLIEPGVTPAEDITLRWDNWTDLAEDCGMSRFWAGLHFRSSIENAHQFAPKIGDLTYEFVQRKIAGR